MEYLRWNISSGIFQEVVNWKAISDGLCSAAPVLTTSVSKSSCLLGLVSVCSQFGDLFLMWPFSG